MSGSSPFRSHLMQQWARSSQSRSPPAVIMPWLKHQQQKQQQLLTNSSFAPHNEEQDDKDSSSSYLSRSNNTSVSSLATSFQSMMMTRHTGTSFSRKAVAMQESQSNQEDQRALLASAIDRAVACGQMAPNHRRTEPFTFKRLIAPSDLTRRLSDIAYHVNLLHSPNSSTQVAEKKRQKWLDVAAFLVALCHDNQHPPPLSSSASSSTTNQDITHGNLEDESQNAKLQSSSSLIYKPLPYCAPESERQLEDYAAACAAVQNVLLSLHSEHIASKWATGPVVETPAFRELVNADPTDRIVALIMIGPVPQRTSHPTTTSTGEDLWLTTSKDDLRRLQRRRQRSRSIQGDLLVDL